MNIHEKAYERAAKMAAKAQPGHMTIDGHLYTFVFVNGNGTIKSIRMAFC